MKLHYLCFSGKKVPKHIRLFLTSEKQTLYIHNGSAQAPSTTAGIMIVFIKKEVLF